MPSIAVVSDSHLSMANPVADRNWDAVVDHLTRTEPDLVLHAGDISADGMDLQADLDHAKAQLDRLPVPWLAVPGNHDLGIPHRDRGLTLERRARYENVFGDRFWVSDLDRWRIVGLDTEELVSDHPDDDAAWAWTAEQLTSDRPTVVLLHRPVAPSAAGLPPDDPAPEDGRRYIPWAAGERLFDLLAQSPMVALISGHIHQWRSSTIAGSQWISAPSTWAYIDPNKQEAIGEKVVGLVEFELEAPEGAQVVKPAGIEQHISGGSRRPLDSSR